MIVSGIHHVSLNVHDASVALAFSRDVLGLTEVERPACPFPGARLEAEVTEPRAVGDTGLRQAFAHDPSGNRVELTEPPS